MPHNISWSFAHSTSNGQHIPHCMSACDRIYSGEGGFAPPTWWYSHVDVTEPISYNFAISVFGKYPFFIIARTAKCYLKLGHSKLQGGREIRPRKVCRREEIVTNFIFKAPSPCLRIHGRNGKGFQLLHNGRFLRRVRYPRHSISYYMILGPGPTVLSIPSYIFERVLS